MYMNPIKLLTLLALLMSHFSAELYAQRDTILLNVASLPTKKRAEAEYYRFVGVPEFGRIKVEDFYFSGKKKAIFFVSSKDTATYDGVFTSYNENGRKNMTGTYISGTHSGVWKSYYSDANQIWSQVEYFPYGGDTTEILKSFYKSGKLKRIEYTGKNFDTGVCYTEEGTIKPFTPFSTMPKPEYDWQYYVSQNIHYPSIALYDGIYGKVDVQFMVAKDGSIIKAVALNDAETPLAKEAVRVVLSMPKWNPGIEDDEIVNVYFTLPVTFRIED